MVKWDTDKDRYMFLYLFADSTIAKEKCAGIIQSWPASFGDPPTVRAIQERVVKLKADLKSQTGISVGPSIGGKSKVKTEPVVKAETGAPATPVSTRKTGKTKPAAGKKRRHADDSSEDEIVETPTKVKKEKNDAVAGDDMDLSPPRASLPRNTKTGGKREELRQWIADAINGSDSDSSVGQAPGVDDEFHPEI